MNSVEELIEFRSGNLRLVGAIRKGAGDLAVVVLHPHPRFGGDMDNHVVLALCETWAAVGASTLRFNFRGTGASEGAFHGAGGEEEDARAAVGELMSRNPHSGLILAGYSFGAGIAASIAEELPLRALVLVSPAGPVTPLERLPANLTTLIVTGEADPVAPPSALVGLAGPRCQVAVIAGAAHSWWPGLDALTEELGAFARCVSS